MINADNISYRNNASIATGMTFANFCRYKRLYPKAIYLEVMTHSHNCVSVLSFFASGLALGPVETWHLRNGNHIS